jgi:hypothetical protein
MSIVKEGVPMPLPLFLLPFLVIGKIAAKKSVAVGAFNAAKAASAHAVAAKTVAAKAVTAKAVTAKAVAAKTVTAKAVTAKTSAAKAAVGKTAVAKASVAKTSAAKTIAAKTAGTATKKTSVANTLSKAATNTVVKKSGAEKAALSVEKLALAKGATPVEAAYTAIGVGTTVSTVWTGAQIRTIGRFVQACKKGDRDKAAMHGLKIVGGFVGIPTPPDFIASTTNWLDRGAPKDEMFEKLAHQAERIVAENGHRAKPPAARGAAKHA